MIRKKDIRQKHVLSGNPDESNPKPGGKANERHYPAGGLSLVAFCGS